MIEANANFFLPISRETIIRVLGTPMDARRLLSELKSFQIASLLFLQKSLGEGAEAIAADGLAADKLATDNWLADETLLGKLIEACHKLFETDGKNELVEYAVANLDYQKIQSGFDHLPDYNIALSADDVVQREAFLTREKLWNYEFSKTHREELQQKLVRLNLAGSQTMLSTEQSALYRAFECQQSEHIHVQGYAGTGKTTFIKCILSTLENSNAKVLILANRKTQLDALRSEIDGKDFVDGCVFTKFVEMIIPDDLTSKTSRTMRATIRYRPPIPDHELIKQLGIYGSEEHDAYVIVSAVRQTLYRYCQSTDEELNLKHIPRRVAAELDATTKQMVCHHATEFWKMILAPGTTDFSPDIRGYHKIKWAALKGFTVPNAYTHVLVDESHDIPSSLLQILENSAQARLTLGDVYQNLNGVELKQAGTVLARELTRSVRSSYRLEGIVNPLIHKHPSMTKAKFHGNNMHRMHMEYYEKASVPKTPTVILVKDVWELFEWTQRIANNQISINLMSSKKDLNWFVSDCIELFNHGTKPRHPELFRFNNWDAVRKRFYTHPGFQRVDRLLEKQYNTQDWQKAQSYIGGLDGHTLALIRDVRNLEFDNVMISPSISGDSVVRYNASFCSSIYVSVTRATKRLLLPETLRHHIEEMSSKY